MPQPIYLTVLRVVITLQTLAVLSAPVTAGLLVSTGTKALHSASAYTVFTVALAHVAVAILAVKPGGGRPGLIGPAVGFLAASGAQVALGIAGVSTWHFPLGVLLFGGSLLQLRSIWVLGRDRAAA